MINILPPDVKQQQRFAKSNSKLLKYLALALITFGALAGLLIFSIWYGQEQVAGYEQILQARQSQREAYQSTEQDVEKLQSNLDTIDKLLNEKTKYSALLSDLAAALPQNSYINHLVLTGDDSQPLEMLVTTDSFNRAAEVRNGLIQSDRISSADIQSVRKDEQTKAFTVVLVLAFEKGQAR